MIVDSGSQEYVYPHFSAPPNINFSYNGVVRPTSASISIGVSILFYEISNKRHSDRAASQFSLNVLRLESDLCELNRL